MASFWLKYTSGVAEEFVECEHEFEAYIANRFGHLTEYLKLGGVVPPTPVAPVPFVETLTVPNTITLDDLAPVPPTESADEVPTEPAAEVPTEPVVEAQTTLVLEPANDPIAYG